MKTSSAAKIKAFAEKGWWGTETTISLFDAAVRNYPDRPALIDPPNREDITAGVPKTYTFTELSQAVTSLAICLHENDIGKDDIVVTQLPNTSDIVVLYLALTTLGAIISPVPIQYGQTRVAQYCE